MERGKKVNQTQAQDVGVAETQAHVRKKVVRKPPLERYAKSLEHIEKRLKYLGEYTKKLESRKEILSMRLKVAQFETDLKDKAQ